MRGAKPKRIPVNNPQVKLRRVRHYALSLKSGRNNQPTASLLAQRIAETDYAQWPEQTKNEEARIVPLPSVLVAMLKDIEPKSGRVFDGTNLRKEWTKACSTCGLGTLTEVDERPYDPIYSGLTLHDLRRSAVRNLRKAGVGEKEAMKILGHKTRSVFDRYNIVSTDDVMDAMRKVELAALTETRKPVRSEVRSETLGDSRSNRQRKSLMALSSRG